MWLTFAGNALLYYLRKLPFGRSISHAAYRRTGLVKACGVLTTLGACIWKFITCFLMAGLVAVLPWRLFAHFFKAENFERDNSLIYFSVIMICFAGSMLHSKNFRVTKMSVMMLKAMKMKPEVYFRRSLLYSLVVEGICYWGAYMIFGMDWIRAFYLALVIVVSRFFGEMMQIQFYRITGKRMTDLRGVFIFVLLLALFVSYFIPYIRETVPAAGNWIFNSVWFTALMTVSAFFIYYVWNYNGYRNIATRIHTAHYLLREMGEAPSREDVLQLEEVGPMEDRFMRIIPNLRVTGYHYLNFAFFRRNRYVIGHLIGVRALVVILVLIFALAMNLLGHGEMVYKIQITSIPVMVFIMYALNIGGRACKILFSQCDRYLLHYGYYRRTEDIVENYLIRLRMITLHNLIPAAILAAAYAIVGATTGAENAGIGIMYMCLEIFLTNLLYSLLQLTGYYLLQPYNHRVEIRNPFFVLFQVALLGIGYGCVFVKIVPIFFVLATALAYAILLSVSVTLVWAFGPRTFNIKK